MFRALDGLIFLDVHSIVLNDKWGVEVKIL